MKVCHQRIGGAKLVPWLQEDISRPGLRMDLSIRRRTTLQSAQCGRAHGHTFAASSPRGVQLISHLRRDVAPFFMQLAGCQVFVF